MKINCSHDSLVEIYKLIPNPKNLNKPIYAVYPSGEIYSFYLKGFLKQRLRKDGYLDIMIHGKMKLVHRLVAECFIGKSNLEINHIDGNKKNNTFTNLEYVTRSQNILHSVNILKNKHVHSGDNNSNCKIKKIDVNEILKMYCSGDDIAFIAKKYSVHTETIKNVMRKIPKCDNRFLKYKDAAALRIKNGRSARWK